jgi:hypothetical protein
VRRGAAKPAPDRATTTLGAIATVDGDVGTSRKAGCWTSQKGDDRSNFLRTAISAKRSHAFLPVGVRAVLRVHVSVDRPGPDDVHSDVLRGEVACRTFGVTFYRALGGGVVGKAGTCGAKCYARGNGLRSNTKPAAYLVLLPAEHTTTWSRSNQSEKRRLT